MRKTITFKVEEFEFNEIMLYAKAKAFGAYPTGWTEGKNEEI